MVVGACRRRLTASAPLPLSAAPEAWRCRAKISVASLARCTSLSGQGEPPTRIAAGVQSGVGGVHTTNQRDEASTASPGGRRGDRAPCSAGTASTGRGADAEGLHAPAGHPRPTGMARRCRSAGVRRPRQAGSAAAQPWGRPGRSGTPGRWRRTVSGKAHRLRQGWLSTPRPRPGGPPTTRGRP